MTGPIAQLCQLIAEKLQDAPEASLAELVAHVEGAIAANAELAAALQSQQQMLQLNRDGAKGFQFVAEDGSTVFVEGTHYHLSDSEKFNSAIEAVFQRFSFSKMDLDGDGRQRYLQSIVNDEDLSEWQECYTPTTLEGRKPPPKPKFSSRLKLRVESVKPPEKDALDASNPDQREQVEQLEVLEGLRKYAPEHVLLMGKPGSGKSTSLEWLLWNEASSALEDPTAKIPVLVKLRRCTSTIEALIQDFFGRHQLPLSLSAIEQLLQQGKLLLLLDGLNELPDAFRTEIANFRERYRKLTPMIVSTREQSIGSTLGITKTLKMLSLSEPQMQEFLRGYLGEEGDRLFQQLKGDRLRKFAETPLLLWMLCRVFAEECSQAEQEQRPPRLPENLGLAFREFTQLYNQKLQEDAPAESRDQWSQLLRHLAFALMHDKELVEFRLSMPKEEAENLLTDCLQKKGRTNARECAEKWLQDLLDYHLIQPAIQPSLEVHIEFRHQLIQEYYAAEYLLRLLSGLNDGELTRDYLNLLKWTEPIALMLALVNDEEQALRVVKLAINDVDFILGARLAGEVQAKCQDKTVDLVDNLEISQLLRNRLLGATRSEKAIIFLEQSLRDRNPYIHKSAANALEEISSDLAVSILSSAVHDESMDVLKRIHIIEILKRIGSLKAIDELADALHNKHDDIRWHAECALKDINSEYATTKLKADSETDTAIQSLFNNSLNPSGLKYEQIFQKMKEDDYDSRQIVNSALEKNTENEISALKSLLNHEDVWVGIYAAEHLGRIGSNEAFNILRKTLEDSNSKIRTQIIQILGEFGDKSVTPALVGALKDVQVCPIAVQALGKVGSPQEMYHLLQLLQLPSHDQINIHDQIILAISAIQNRYKFYNYEIFHGLPPQGKNISLYFSYAPADELLQTQLANHLTLLERQGVITSWSQRQILPGDEPAQVINQQLNTADIILLLISANSLADDTCYNLEIQRAIERHQTGETRVIPILLRPADWSGAPFSQLEVLPRNHQPVTTWANQDEAFRAIAEGIRAVAMELRRERAGEWGSRGVGEIGC